MQNSTTNQQREPIAIVGMGCRFPGGANSPEQFWQLLVNGVDAITEVPETRWHIRDYFDADSLEPGKTYSKWGGFINGIEKFDAPFFKISSRETQRIDPQHRLLLEVTWEALEDAGAAPQSLQGSDTGVFIGLMTHDYGDLQASSEQLETANAYVIGGSILSLASNRISNFFDFCGPSLTTDTACSSSLTAVHLACQSLWTGETPLALAGGANLLLSPHMMVVISKARLLAEDGRCKSFDASADGYVRAEGAGVVVLKLLSQAQQDGDRIYATIDASVMSQDGHKLGIGAPKQSSQERLFQRACQQADIAPAQVNYIEAHGTGTLAGDPVEANAVGQVFGQRPSDSPACVMGSVKSNIGHLEAASGIAGLIKTALCLSRRQIPASLHFNTPNPKIDFHAANLQIPQALTAFPANAQGQYLAGLNSFGFGGTNAHLLLSTQPDSPQERDRVIANDAIPDAPMLIPVSARTPIALKAFIQSLLQALQADPPPPLQDLAHSLSLRRAHHNARTAFVASSIDEFISQLQSFLTRQADYLSQKKAISRQPQDPTLVFVCSGMAQQTCGTARQLMLQEAGFAETLHQIDAVFQPLADWSIVDEIMNGQDQERWNQVAVAQPLTFAIQVGLAQVWKNQGIIPTAVIGHSAGEVAAACISEALSLADATRLVFHRSRLQQMANHSGKMVVVGLTRAQVELLLVGYQQRVEIAAINSPQGLTLSGEAAAIEQIAQSLEQQDIFVRLLPGTIAYHSQAMAAAQTQIVDCLPDLSPQPTTIPMVSTVTGAPIAGETLDAHYWARNIREVVNFQGGIDHLLQQGHQAFLELSSHPVLKSPIHHCAQAAEQPIRYLHTLHRKLADRPALLTVLGQLYERGYPLHWPALNPSGQFWPFPLYPWQKQTYWYQDSLAYEKPQLGEPNRAEAAIAAPTHLPHSTTASSDRDADRPPALDSVYHSQWMEAPAATSCSNTTQNWLLISQGAILAHSLAATLSADFQQRVLLLRSGESADLATALAAEFDWGEMGGELNVIYISDNYCASDQWLGDDMLTQSMALCTELVNWLQTLSQHPNLTLNRLYILTDTAQNIDHDYLFGLEQSVLWGLGRVIANELPESRCTCIDLSYAEDDGTIIPQLIQELLGDHQEQEIALRNGKKYLNHIQPGRSLLSPARTLHIPAECTYLVVGGFGGFGLAIAQWLAEQGCRHLVLVSRQIPDVMDALPEVLAMRALGATVTPLSCDVAQLDPVIQLLNTIDTTLPPLRGIIHCAMVLDDASLANLTPDRFQRVLAPKVAGAYNLHRCTAMHQLEHFVLCSSVSAVLGTPGQGNYAAANAFLDALAHDRQASGQHALSLNWGLLADVGYVIRNQKQEMFAPLERVGWVKLPCREALTVLGQAMASDAAQLIVAPMDWAKWKRCHAVGQSVRFSQLGQLTQPIAAAPDAIASTNLPPSPEAQRLTLQRQIQEQVAQVFQMAITEVDLHQPLTDMGLDSLTSVELKTAITQKVGVNITLSSVLSGSTVAELCEQTLKQFQALPPANPVPQPPEVAPAPAPIAQPPVQRFEAAIAPQAPAPVPTANLGFICLSQHPKPKLRLFCFPYAGGGPAVFKDWPQHLPADVEVYALQLPGRGQRLQEPLLTTMPAVIADMLTHIQSLLVDVPAVFFGHCLGALQMFELAHQLQNTHQPMPRCLVVSGARSPQFYTDAQFQVDVAQYSPLSPIPGHQLPEAAFLDMLQDLNFSTSQALFDDQEMRDLLLPTVRADLELNNTYRYQTKPPLEIPIVAIGGRVDPYVTGEHVLGWQAQTRQDFATNFCPGNHYFIETQRPFLIEQVVNVLKTRCELDVPVTPARPALST